MTGPDLVAILPIVVLTSVTLVVMVLIGFYRGHALTVWLACAGLVAALALLPVAAIGGPRPVTQLLTIDGYAIFFMGLIFAAALVVTVLTYGYLQKHGGNREELYVLILLATIGSAVLVASTHFASFFLGLEILSVSLYAMVAYVRTSAQGVEAGVKYLVLAAASAAFLLFGIALIYADQGTMEFSRVSLPSSGASVLFLMGVAMLSVGIGFKLAVVPFHMWTPDVYEGAPAPITGFIATISKGAMFALLVRLFKQVGLASGGSVFIVFTIIAVASMLVGNLLALLQRNVKRLLAYSSIAHLGYLLVAFLASGALAVTAVAFYLVAYFVTTLGAFGIVGVLSSSDRDADKVEDYRGLFWRRPWLAMVFTATLLSLAGIPLTAGFIGKFYVLNAGVGSALWLLVITLVVSSVIGLYYYLRLIVTMYLSAPEEEAAPVKAPASYVPAGGGFVLAALFLLLLWFGIYPAPLIRLIEATVAKLL